ncbi:MAG: tRNA (adenosine(37)-N6)-threonylcarbamoyltransferase complex ATPase subunit type 1 TsaE [Candidatus Nanosynbacter sp.]|nr:tRNA (adenosine(37)-N6)-threonylcarbamoyltransferase complex ATPase subunit type 1 TsaE [Candidatus Nanosynbacter sp.]
MIIAKLYVIITFMIIKGESSMKKLGKRLGDSLRGGEIIELIGDVGAGKTTLTRGIARSLGIEDTLQSPTFTISREYKGEKLRLVHYDFYRLSEPGIMADELDETLKDTNTVSVIEWSDAVEEVLPDNRIIIKILPVSNDENSRDVEITIPNTNDYINFKMEEF